MANTKVPVELSSTPGIVDNSNATAITIDSNEDITIGGKLNISTGTNGTPTINLSHTNANADNFRIACGVTGVANSGLSIYDVDATATRFVIDSNGNIGIGATSPSMKVNISHGDQDGLRFNCANTAETFIDFGDTDDNDVGQISYDHADNSMAFKTNAAERLTIDSSGNAVFSGATITVGDSHTFGNGSGDNLHIETSSGENIVINSAGGIHVFQDNGTERMRISAGNVGIGTTTPGYNLDVVGASGTMSRIQSGGSSTYLAIKNSSNTGYIGVDSTNLEFYPTASKAATLQSNGNLFIGGTLTQSYSFSDERLKENITVITDAIEKVKTLRGITFTRKQDKGEGTGLIAQELEKVLPQAVYEPEPQIDRDPISGEARGEIPETYKAIHYGNTVGLLVEAIKELSTKLEAAEARITELEE